jgi:hypothetical protein
MSFCWCKGLVATSNCTTHQPEGYERPSILEAPEITQACNQKRKLKFGNTGTVSAWLDLHITTFSYQLEHLQHILKVSGQSGKNTAPHTFVGRVTGPNPDGADPVPEGTKVWYCKQKGRHCTVPRPPLWYSVPCLRYGADVSLWLPPRPLTTT